MPVSKDERNRILLLIETGQVSASEASQLLDALEEESAHTSERLRERTLRIRTIGINRKRQKVALSAALPVNLLKISLRLGQQLMPQLNNEALEEMLRSIEQGANGRLLDLHDLENGERLEIFVE